MTENKNEIMLFKHEEFGEVRTLMIDGEPWFVGLWYKASGVKYAPCFLSEGKIFEVTQCLNSFALNKNAIMLFKHEEFGEVRTLMIDGEPWFVGKDITSVLGYSNHSKALNDHVDAEDIVTLLLNVTILKILRFKK